MSYGDAIELSDLFIKYTYLGGGEHGTCIMSLETHSRFVRAVFEFARSPFTKVARPLEPMSFFSSL